eukprot:TRINITY_DN7421_c0_g2_i2.p1 TRINITY_DN7421_c0_g2~~TRINITY_DN7421_c0_g2_i2.p1  ORF type:complete len:165 (+),score=31.28 TRINITY_DN7421_c0_g2_i2:68-496(+)
MCIRDRSYMQMEIVLSDAVFSLGCLVEIIFTNKEGFPETLVARSLSVDQDSRPYQKRNASHMENRQNGERSHWLIIGVAVIVGCIIFGLVLAVRYYRRQKAARVLDRELESRNFSPDAVQFKHSYTRRCLILLRNSSIQITD